MLRCRSLQLVYPWDIPVFVAEQEARFGTRSSLFAVAECVKEEKPADLPDLLLQGVPGSPGSVVLFLEMFMREEGLIFPLRTAKFIRAGWMVVASLFRKEKVDIHLSADTDTFSCKAVVWRSKRFSV